MVVVCSSLQAGMDEKPTIAFAAIPTASRVIQTVASQMAQAFVLRTERLAQTIRPLRDYLDSLHIKA